VTELSTFDGLDNRREVMILLQRLGSDEARAAFLWSLIPLSRNGFANIRAEVRGSCDPVGAYFMLVSICNEVGVSIDNAAALLDERVRVGN
jgi:hypothetical protein